MMQQYPTSDDAIEGNRDTQTEKQLEGEITWQEKNDIIRLQNIHSKHTTNGKEEEGDRPMTTDDIASKGSGLDSTQETRHNNTAHSVNETRTKKGKTNINTFTIKTKMDRLPSSCSSLWTFSI